jgi:hypothetical protein
MKEMTMNLEEIAVAEMENELSRLRELAARDPKSSLAQANQASLQGNEERWHGTGTIEMAGVAWWALSLPAILPHHNSFIFSATGGPDWAVTVFAGPVAGVYVVNPSTLKSGRYRFTLNQATFKAGGVVFHLYSMKGKLLGTNTGVIGGVGVSSLSGIGKISH